MKTIEQLEQEAKQARDDMRDVMLDEFGIGATLSDRILSLMIRAVQSNIAHNDAKQEVSADSDGWIKWDGGAKALTREYVQVKFRSNQTAFGKIIYLNWDHQGGEWDIIAYRIVKGE